MDLVRRQGVDEVLHALSRIFGVATFREAGHQFLESVERFLRTLRVALGQVLIR